MNKVFVIIALGLAVSVVPSEAKEWYETAAFYQIYPQSFYDGGGGFEGTGTLRGIKEKLGYIKSLGVDCLWLTPIFESTFNAYGYDITNYTGIDPRYGSFEDFKDLVKAIHDEGMKIIVDFVPNHCGKDHAFFKKSVKKEENYDDWFVWTNLTGYDGKPSNWQRIGGEPGSAWNKDEERNEFYYAQFSGNMPDLNLRNVKVLEYFDDVLKFWLDIDIDGFRIDAISHGIEVLPKDGKYEDEAVNESVVDPKDFGHLIHNLTQDQPELFSDVIKRWRKLLDDYQKDKKGAARIMMTESYSPPDVIKQYYEAGSHLPFNFQMINTIKANSTARDFVEMVDNWLKILPKGKVTNWVIGNHDQSRAASRFGRDRIAILNTLVTLLPGTSVTYYGEEIGMEDSCAKFGADHNVSAKVCTEEEKKSWSDSWVRSPMQWDDTENAGFSKHTPWIPAGESFERINVKAQEGKPDSHLEKYKKLLKLRKHKAIMDESKFEIKVLGEYSFAFKRELLDKEEQSVIVFINFSNATETVNLKKAFSDLPDLFTVELTGLSSVFKQGHQVSFDSDLELKKFESVVAFYNSSIALIVSNATIIMLIASLLLNFSR